MLMAVALPAVLLRVNETAFWWDLIGSVNTEFKLIGPDHRIAVESYDDPKIDSVTSYVGKSQMGGIKGGPGMCVVKPNVAELLRHLCSPSAPVRQKGAIEEESF
jgi:CreA protein